MKKWSRRIGIFLLTIAAIGLALGLAHVIADKRGQADLEAASERLQRLRGRTALHPGDRPSVHEECQSRNGAYSYCEALEALDGERLAGADSDNAIRSFFEGKMAETRDLEREVSAHAFSLAKLREGVGSSRCDWQSELRLFRTCGLGGASLARIGYRYEPCGFGLYTLVPRLAAMGELARRKGDHFDALQIFLECMQVCVDMARGPDSLNAVCASVRLERLNELVGIAARGLTPDDAGWKRVAAALERLHQRNEVILGHWRYNLLLSMFAAVYLPTYPRIVMVDPNESAESWRKAALTHKMRTFFSAHASSARLFRLSEELWNTIEALNMRYSKESVLAVVEAVGRSRVQDVYHREAADSVLYAVAAAFRLEAALRMIRVSWALAQYRSQSGQWPDSLDQAAPPPGCGDPFTGKPFSYAVEDRPVLSSNGLASGKTWLPFRPLRWSLPP